MLEALPYKPIIRTAIAADAVFIAQNNVTMAFETEGLLLNIDTCLKGVSGAISDAAKGLYLVAELEGELAGNLMITKEWSDWRNSWIYWLQSVFVLPAFRGKGVFKALLEGAVEIARQENSPSIRLYVENTNYKAIAAYLKTGFNDSHYKVLEKTII